MKLLNVFFCISLPLNAGLWSLFCWEEQEHDFCFRPHLLLGTSVVASWGQGRVKSHPIEMEMSWEAPALLGLSC